MTSFKVLVAGDVEGNFNKLFKKVKKIITKSGPFSFLICVGSFFGCQKDDEWKKYIEDDSEVPLQVYILGPNEESQAQFYPHLLKTTNINDKITSVGRAGVFTTMEGLQIAYLSGLEYRPESNQEICFNADDIKNLIKLCNKKRIDILITSPWPSEITKNDKFSSHNPSMTSNLLKTLIPKIRPKYHFSGCENIYYTRTPFCYEDKSGNVAITRFVGLPRIADSDKWCYAFNITPSDEISEYDLQHLADYKSSHPFTQDKVKPGTHVKRSSDCWFCLGSPKIEKHLIISIGTYNYLAVAKGGIVDEHFLIVPIDHTPSLSLASDKLLQEIEQFKKALRRYFDDKNMDVIFYERFYKTIHLQLNCIGLPRRLRANLQLCFQKRAEVIGIEMEEYPVRAKAYKNFNGDENYFYVELDEEDAMICRITDRFPLHFGREVLARKDVLNLPGRSNWNDCIKSEEEENILVQNLKCDFKPFDFTQ